MIYNYYEDHQPTGSDMVQNAQIIVAVKAAIDSMSLKEFRQLYEALNEEREWSYDYELEPGQLKPLDYIEAKSDCLDINGLSPDSQLYSIMWAVMRDYIKRKRLVETRYGDVMTKAAAKKQADEKALLTATKEDLQEDRQYGC